MNMTLDLTLKLKDICRTQRSNFWMSKGTVDIPHENCDGDIVIGFQKVTGRSAGRSRVFSNAEGGSQGFQVKFSKLNN